MIRYDTVYIFSFRGVLRPLAFGIPNAAVQSGFGVLFFFFFLRCFVALRDLIRWGLDPTRLYRSTLPLSLVCHNFGLRRCPIDIILLSLLIRRCFV
jgi:hypothetical protein